MLGRRAVTSDRGRHARLTVHTITVAKPRAKEYALWDGTLAHFEVPVHPSGVRSFVAQIRAQGGMRKITLGRFPETNLERARRKAAAVLAHAMDYQAEPPPLPDHAGDHAAS